MYTIKFVGCYRKIDLAKTIDTKMNGLQVNCPKAVAWFFFIFVSFLIGKLWMKSFINFRLTTWKCLPFKNEKFEKTIKKKTKLTKINTIWIKLIYYYSRNVILIAFIANDIKEKKIIKYKN